MQEECLWSTKHGLSLNYHRDAPARLIRNSINKNQTMILRLLLFFRCLGCVLDVCDHSNLCFTICFATSVVETLISFGKMKIFQQEGSQEQCRYSFSIVKVKTYHLAVRADPPAVNCSENICFTVCFATSVVETLISFGKMKIFQQEGSREQ